MGEDALLARIAHRIGPARTGEVWAGDDAAVVASAASRILIATDLMVEGIDFDLSYVSGEDIGWKVVAVNVSDIAAMGGVPRSVVAGVALPPETKLSFVDGFLDGLVEAAAEWDVAVVGGDLSGGREIVAVVTVVGDTAEPPLLRSGARVGDGIFVTGTLGGSAGGLAALRAGFARTRPVVDLVARHLRPRARVVEAAALRRFGITAMIDISDGFALDLRRLMRASGTGCLVDPGRLAVDLALLEVADELQVDAHMLALHGGEDFELLFTMDRSAEEDARDALVAVGCGLAFVGEVTDGGRFLGDIDLDKEEGLGWDHLQDP